MHVIQTHTQTHTHTHTHTQNKWGCLKQLSHRRVCQTRYNLIYIKHAKGDNAFDHRNEVWWVKLLLYKQNIDWNVHEHNVTCETHQRDLSQNLNILEII